MFDIKEELRALPDTPGVYLHKDQEGTIIYVGKAVSLKNRVRQYFQASKNMDAKVKAMVKHIASFEYIQTKTEMEALILECNLIKKYMPKYNVLLRDDKTFPYIKITFSEKWPRVVKTRRLDKGKDVYFGPYTDATGVNHIIDLLNSIYALKRCNYSTFPEGFKPCLNYHIGQCKGMCVGGVDHETYLATIAQVENFLNGKSTPVLSYLTEKMGEEAEAMNFELAAEYRDYIGTVHEMTKMAKIAKASQVAKEAKIAEKARILDEKSWRKKEKNAAAENYLNEIIRNGQRRIYAWRIEAYDISNTNGVDSVGAMVVFRDGVPVKSDYRRFKIKTVEGPNDYGSLQEVLYRRFKRGIAGDKGFQVAPDLILMDGGRAQVSVVEQVLLAMNVEIPVAGMVKDDKHRTRGLVYRNEEFSLQDRRELYHYLGKIQEEVHRFAITYHQEIRNKGMHCSELDKVEGIGEKRRNDLLRHFGSIDAIKKPSWRIFWRCLL
ncbi:MAG: excinuclease ABC subunit UvrC [Anaerovorax sp.]